VNSKCKKNLHKPENKVKLFTDVNSNHHFLVHHYTGFGRHS